MGLSFYSILLSVNLIDCNDIDCAELDNINGKCDKECRIGDRRFDFCMGDQMYKSVYEEIFNFYYKRFCLT